MKRLALLLMLVALAPAYADGPAQHLLNCMRANLPSTLQVQQIELTTTQRNGDTRTLKGKLYVERVADKKGDRLLRAMLRINSPDYMAGSAYLMRETPEHRSGGMYIYLPAVKRVRKVTGTLADGALLGTDFSYTDFKQIEGAFGDFSPSFHGKAKVDGRTTEILSFKAKPGITTPYSGVRAWVDTNICMPLKVEFFENGKVRKRLQAPVGTVKNVGKFRYLSELDMTDLARGSHTMLRILKVSSKPQAEAWDFDPETFYRVKK